jgi:carboxyl-terminal processing protease
LIWERLARKRGEVVGERSFGAGTEQQLFPLKSGGGMLLTVAKWASPSGNTFLGTERTNTGIKPSVEVKKPDTPEPLEVDELIDQQEDQNQNPQPEATPNTTKPEVKPATTEDFQLKKALELLSDKAATAKSGE